MTQLATFLLGGVHWLLALVIALAFGWRCEIPQDPKGTLTHVRAGVLRVGIPDAPPWSHIDDTGAVAGSEVELVLGYAEQYNARVEWVHGPLEDLLERLEHFRLDIVVGGLTDSSPWKKRISFTRPYLTERDPVTGKDKRHVLAVPPGENGFLMSLEQYLTSAVREPYKPPAVAWSQ